MNPSDALHRVTQYLAYGSAGIAIVVLAFVYAVNRWKEKYRH